MEYKINCIGVFTSGGDAPGMNAAIRAVTRAAISNGIKVKAIYRGYKGLIDDDIREFTTQDVSGIVQRGGTIIKSARCMEFKTPEGRRKGYENLKKRGIEGLVIIGGDGSLTGGSLLSKETGMPVLVSEDALSCVGEGTGKSLENIELLKRVVMTSQKLSQ